MAAAAAVAAAARGGGAVGTAVRAAGDQAGAGAATSAAVLVVVLLVLKPQGLESLCVPRRERGFESPLVLGTLCEKRLAQGLLHSLAQAVVGCQERQEEMNGTERENKSS